MMINSTIEATLKEEDRTVTVFWEGLTLWKIQPNKPLSKDYNS